MRDYIKGMITGASLMLCLILLLGSKSDSYGNEDIYNKLKKVEDKVEDIADAVGTGDYSAFKSSALYIQLRGIERTCDNQ